MMSCPRLIVLLVSFLGAVWTASLSSAQRPDIFRSNVVPNALSYTLPVHLNNVINPEAITKLSAAQKQQLGRLGFVVVPDQAEQMFYLYEEYGEESLKPVPNFVTIDSVLHAYHLFYDFTLRMIETRHLIAAAQKLTDIGLFHSVKFFRQLPAGPWREAAAANAAYFAIAKSLLSGKAVTTGLGQPWDKLVAQELALIKAHEGRRESALLGTTVHYDQFIPRGHYTRSEALKKYFMGMMWYGQIGLHLEWPQNEALARKHTRMALLITRMLANDDQMRALWGKIYEPTSFYVGFSDDLGFGQYVGLARSIYGPTLPLEALANETKLTAFLQQARLKLPRPQIAPYYRPADTAGNIAPQADTAYVQPRQFRLMGQRFIPDSYILQQLVSPLVKPAAPDDARDVPMGLDVMAALGSERALHILTTLYRQNRFPGYLEQMEKLRREFATKTEREWWQNLYWGWLYTLKALLGEFGTGYPVFMRQAEWQDKELQTSLGSWAQLRHDTILYAKPSGAEMGGMDEMQMPQGYVEPVPEAFARLAYLTQISYDGLKRRGLMDPSLQKGFSQFKDLLLFLKGCAEKQLARQPLTPREYQRIWWIGGELERLQLSVVQASGEYAPVRWGELISTTDRHMATIADIHTAFLQALEVGVGPAYRIYVIVPRADGKLQIAKGGVFSYYEFLWPVSDRLTDEKWQQMLKTGQQPPQPDWTRSFIVGPPYPYE